MLIGREHEQRALDGLLQSARDERSVALVLRGEPGIGKTALLGYAADRATDMRVLRCVGIESEHELPFAGMHQLVRPCLDLVDRLPAPQAAALRGALGLSFDAPGVPELEVRGLADGDARALLTAQLARAAPADVVATLLNTAHGNPLALLELPSALTAAQLEGAEPILGPPPVRGAVEAAFGARVERLPEATRRLLLLAAADEAGDLAALDR